MLKQLKVTSVSATVSSATMIGQDTEMIPYLLQCNVEMVFYPEFLGRILSSCRKRTIQMALVRAVVTEITEKHLVAAARNRISSKDALQAVLQHTKSCSITEEVIVAAAEGNFRYDSYEVSAFVATRCRNNTRSSSSSCERSQKTELKP